MIKKENAKRNMILLISTITIFILVMFFVGQLTKNYSREAYVEYNNGEEIVFTDVRGHMWGWTIETKEEYSLAKGDKVILTFNNNGTDEVIEDDILTKIKKKN